MKAGLIPFISFLFTVAASGQVTVVEGSLTDSETGTPVPYASVSLVGTAVGTSSNGDGSFTLKIPEPFTFKKITIKITCVGYENYVIENAAGRMNIRLKPSKIILKEIVVSSAELTPDRIVKKAFDRVRKNYDTKPFVYQTFYRHYCKDDDQYGRLIEAAVDIYKRKGYRTFQRVPGAKDEVRVTQLRRSFDNTKVMINHAPIALYTIMTADEVAYQSQSQKGDFHWAGSMSYHEMSTLQKHPDQYDFSLDNTTTFDNEEVYKVSYRMREDVQKPNAEKGYAMSCKGVLYINTRNFAFVKTESQRQTPFDTVRTSSSYRLNGDHYYLFHSLREGQGTNRQLNIRHQYHIELTTTKILTRNHPVFKGKEPGKEVLFIVPYDSTFWDDYNIIKATPLEEKIVADLERNASLKNQFSNYSEVEMERFFSGKEDEERFNQYLKFNKGRVMYVSFWKSDCGACLRELEYSRKLIDKYKHRVAFVYLSLDSDLQLWKEALKKHKLTSVYANHFRIGPDADAIRLFEVSETPRYVLVNKNGFFADQNARRPTDPDLERDIERLLAEKVDKP